LERLNYLEKLTELHDQQQKKVNDKKKELGALAQKAGGNDPVVRQIGQLFKQQLLGSLQQDLIRAKSDLMHCTTDLAIKLAEQKSLAEAKLPQERVDELLNKEPTVQKHQQDVAYLKDTIEKHKVRSQRPPATDPDLLKYQLNLKKEEAALKAECDRLTPEVSRKARIETGAELARSIRQLELQIATH